MDILRLTLRQLQIFVAVARTGSTTAAGEAIALSQSATCSAVNGLERLLSLQLFDRAGKRLLLNDNGRALLPQAQALLEGASTIERMSQSADAQLQKLRIGASTTIGTYVLPRLLTAFLSGRHAQAEAWQSSVMVGNTAAICARVAAFELDIGLIEGPSHEPAVLVHAWLADEMVVVASPSHQVSRANMEAERAGRNTSLASLRDAVWLLRESGSGTREATDEALLPHLRGYRKSIELGSSEAIKHAAAAGLGLACLSKLVASDFLESGRLRVVRSGLPRIMRQCHWVIHRDKQFTPAMSRFIDLLKAASQPSA